MRTWRVGTFSMGAALLFLGIFLLLSQWLGYDLMNVMLSWWPLILVVLGVEILVFLFLSRQEKPYLKYDFLSIIFVGMIGTAGIGFAILSSTGLIDQVKEMLAREERTFQLPEFSQNIPPEVKRIVVQTDNNPITIEGATEKEISLFGTYRANTGKDELLVEKAEDYVSIQQKGDSLYVNVHGLPRETGPFSEFVTLAATILVPMDVKLEVMAKENPITLKPRRLLSDWSVDSASSVLLHLQKQSDVLVSATGSQELQSPNNEWQITKNGDAADGEEGMQDKYTGETYQNGTFKLGKGTYSLNIINSYSVSLNTGQ